MVRTTTRSVALPKTVAIVVGLGVAVGLAMAAPVRAASPSTAASQIVDHHRWADGEHARHRTGHERAPRR